MESTTASTEQKGLVWILVLGGLLWVLARGRATATPAPSPPGVEPLPGPLPGEGRVTLDARVGTIKVSARARQQVTKKPGGLVAISFPYSFLTRQNGTPIDWRYRMRVAIGHTTGLFGTFGWKTSDELGKGIATSDMTYKGKGSFTRFLYLIAPDELGQLWDVHVTIWAAATDDPDGPIGDSNMVAEAKADGVLMIAKPALVTTLDATIGAVQVSQTARLGIGRR